MKIHENTEIPTRQLAEAVDHLLGTDEFETEDPKLRAEVEFLRTEVRGAVYLCAIDLDVFARAYLLGVIDPRLNKLIVKLDKLKNPK